MYNVIKKRGLIVALALIAGFGISGCTNDDTNLKATEQTVKAKATASFAGQVVDANGDPISGARVTIFANKKYNTSTDRSGNYLVEVSLGDVVASGGGGTATDEDPGDDIERATGIERDFPMEVSKSGYAVFRQVIDFEGQIGYTDGSGAVVLLSQTGSALPKTLLLPYVDEFTFTVYAGGSPAPGAVVTLDGSYNASDATYTTDYDDDWYYKTGYRTFVADDSGNVTITTDDELPANNCYGAFVAPYDADGDGAYEYDATNTSSCFFRLSAYRNDSSSMIHYDGSGNLVQTENAPTINLADYDSDITVVYNSLQGRDSIPVAQAADFSITIMLNRPVTDAVLAGYPGPLFELSSNDGNMPVPITVTDVGNYLYTITPDITLDPSRNEYRLYVNDAISFSGDWDTTDDTYYADNSQYFVIYDPNATLSGAITPGLDIDDDTTYKVDWDRFLTGDATEDNPLSEDSSQGGSHGDDLRLSFAADTSATGYQVWVKDSGSPWINVEEADNGSLTFTQNNGQFIEVTVNEVFDAYFAGGEFVDDPDNTLNGYYDEPMLNGNTLQVVVMPENINGFATNPNNDNTIAGLALTDNWGPEVMNSGSSSFDFTATTGFNSGTYCDAEDVNIAVGEPLDGSVTLTPEFAADEYGAKAVTGSPCFAVAAVHFADYDLVAPGTGAPYPSSVSYLQVDLEPAVKTTLSTAATTGDYLLTVADNSNLTDSDNVRIGDSTDSLLGVLGNDQLIVNVLPADEDAASDVYWRGPVQNGYDEITGTLGQNSGTYSQRVWLADNASDDISGSNARLSSGELVISVFDSSYDLDYINMDAAFTAAVAPGSPITGYNVNQLGTCNAFLSVDPAPGDTVITVNDPTNCEVGDPVVLDFDDNGDGIETRSITAISGSDLTLNTGLTNDHAINETVDERVAWSTTTPTGWPMLYLGSNSTHGMKVGSTITFDDNAGETDSAAVVSAFQGYVGLDDIPRDSSDTDFYFATGADWSNDSSRAPDALEVQVMDTAGNNSSDDTDSDGDGNANYDQIGYEEANGGWGVF